MNDCIERGFHGTGLLRRPEKKGASPRSAAARMLVESSGQRLLDVMDWVNAFALAVNEENAAAVAS